MRGGSPHVTAARYDPFMPGGAPVAGNQDMSTRVQAMLAAAGHCFEAESSDGYAALSEQLEELEAAARETVQAHADYRSMLTKLDRGTPLSADELHTLKLLIVGDADSYLKYDDEFDRWKSELKRILEAIRGLKPSDGDADALMHLRVLCREASSVLAPTAYYMEQKERVSHFDDATRGPIDPQSGRLLADLVRRMMDSTTT
jgi:hypothetical protein